MSDVLRSMMLVSIVAFMCGCGKDPAPTPPVSPTPAPVSTATPPPAEPVKAKVPFEDKQLRLSLALDIKTQQLVVIVTNIGNRNLYFYRSDLDIQVEALDGAPLEKIPAIMPLDTPPDECMPNTLKPDECWQWHINLAGREILAKRSNHGGYWLGAGSYLVRAVLRREEGIPDSSEWLGHLESDEITLAIDPSESSPMPVRASKDGRLRLELAADEQKQELVVTVTNVGKEDLQFYFRGLAFLFEPLDGGRVTDVPCAPGAPPRIEVVSLAAGKSATKTVSYRTGSIAPHGYVCGGAKNLSPGSYRIRAVLCGFSGHGSASTWDGFIECAPVTVKIRAQ